MTNMNFLLLLCIACVLVLVTPLASLASFAIPIPTFLSPIGVKSEFNIANIVQSLAALALLSVFLERAIEIVSNIFDQDKNIMSEDQRIKWVPLVTLIVGIIISSIGIRGLEPFFTVINNEQGNLFRLIDIILTGTVISGGTAGIHKILTSLTAFLDVTKASAEAEKDSAKVKAEAGQASASAEIAKAEAEKAGHELEKFKHEEALKSLRNP
jgi:hypothetical protein